MEEWVTIATYDEVLPAEIFRGRLEAEGIPAKVVFERMSSSAFPSLAPADGIAVKVPLPLSHKAMDVFYDLQEEDRKDPPTL
ncbi:MAG: hypothetical protein LPK80_10020 [Bacteroidota bacterium]|nr:hypothetical protein [Bacteroidota bacterium]